MNQKAAILMVVISVLIGCFAIYISFLPKLIVSTSQVKVDAEKQKVIEYLSSAENYQDWILSGGEHEIKILKAGKEKGEGSVLKWFSSVEGDGAVEVKSVSDSLIRFIMITDDNQFRNSGYFKLEEKEGVQLSWTDTLDVSTNMNARFAAKSEEFKAKVQETNTQMLNKLKSILEQ